MQLFSVGVVWVPSRDDAGATWTARTNREEGLVETHSVR